MLEPIRLLLYRNVQRDLYRQSSARASIKQYRTVLLLGEDSCGCHLTGAQSDRKAVVVSAHEDKSEDLSDSAADQQFAKLVERIKDDEGMQQALYAYLPDHMHNKEAVVRMVSSPEYRQMLESMMQAYIFHPLSARLVARMLCVVLCVSCVLCCTLEILLCNSCSTHACAGDLKRGHMPGCLTV